MRALQCVFLSAGLFLAGAMDLHAQEPAPQQPVPQQPVPQKSVPDKPAPPEVTPDLKPLPDEPLPQAGDSLFAPLAIGPRGESFHTKLDSYLVISFGPRAVVSPAISAGFKMAFPNYNYPNNWHQGMQGFGRQYGSAYGTKVAEQTGRYGASMLLHEDFRYRPSGATGFFPRLGHALAFTVVDRSDSGNARLAVSNFVGAAAGGFTPIAWLPDGFNSPKDGGRRTATKLGSFAIQNVTREFYPEIHKVFQALHLPNPSLPLPGWWNSSIDAGRR